MKKCCVLGHFACDRNAANGQTVKTKIITDELKKQLGEDSICSIDTFGGAKVLLKAPFQVLFALRSSQNVIMLPAHNGVRVYGRLLPLFRKFFENRKIHYVVIGGWLPLFLGKRKMLAKSLKKFDGIYVETSMMKQQLAAQGFNNVFVMPNCKDLNTLKKEDLIYSTEEPFRLCTFSRVTKEKGIGDAVEAVKAANEKHGRVIYTLDIYGAVDSDQILWFDQLQKSFPPYVKYRGLVDFNESTEVLKKYFCLLFPTHYYTEGVPGTIIDAYAAGVPVIAARWQNFEDVIDDGITGIGYEFGNKDELVRKLIDVANCTEQINRMKLNGLRKSREFIPRNVMVRITENLN